MSKIAEALAKARERTGTTSAPFMAGNAGVPPVPVSTANKEALRKASRAQLFWIFLTIAVGCVTGLIIWTRLYPDRSLRSGAESAAPAPPCATPLLAPTGPSPSAPSAPAAVVLPPRSVASADGTPTAPLPGAAPLVAPGAELYRVVQGFVISAVLPGDQPRLMYQGRVVHVGDAMDADLLFAGIQDGQIVFNDRRGAIYVRRY